MNSAKTCTTPLYAGKKVLVVDNLPQHLRYMQRSLESIGFVDIEHAASADEGISKCSEKYFDLVFCDYNLGSGKNGQQMLEELRYLNYVRNDCVIIMITAETSRDVVLSALEAAPEGYIVKPFNDVVLSRKIDRLMRKQENLGEVHAAIAANELEQALRLCDLVAAANPRYQTWCAKTKGELYLRKGDYFAAQNLYESLIQERLVDWALIGLAKSYIGRGEPGKAAQELEQALVLNRNNVEALDLLAECARIAADANSAERYLLRATDLAPRSPKRQWALGQVAGINGHLDISVKAYRSAIRSSRYSMFDNDDCYLQLAASLTDSMAADKSRDDSTFEVEITALLGEIDAKFGHKKNARMLCKLIEIRMKLNKQETYEAIRMVEEAEQQWGFEVSNELESYCVEWLKTYKQLGKEDELERLQSLCAQQSDWSQESRLFLTAFAGEQAKQGLCKNVSSLNERGAKAYEDHRLVDAIADFTQAVAISPFSVVVNLNLAQALLKKCAADQESGKRLELARIHDCLSVIGDVPKESPHYARYSNLIERLNEFDQGNVAAAQ